MSVAEIVIREANTAERRQAADLVITAFSVTASPPTPNDRAALARAITDGYADRTHTTALTAWSGTRLVGAILYAATGAESAGFPADWAVLRALGVTTDAVGRGIGTALTVDAVGRGMTEGAGGIGLYTADTNLRARHLYAALGFVVMSPGQSSELARAGFLRGLKEDS